VLEAIDGYAMKHSLSGCGAVVREALAQLLGIEITRQRSDSCDHPAEPTADCPATGDSR
jgi:hypothetical protein